jgi:predicted GNAT family acetyltransferase
MPPPTAAAVAVLDVLERSRFEVRVDGELAGFAEYRLRPPLIAFTHTLIDPRFEGQGLATHLIRAALSEARSAGLESSVLRTALGSDVKGKISPLLHCLGIGLSFADRWIALAVYVGVALMWLVPDRRVERHVSTVPRKPRG